MRPRYKRGGEGGSFQPGIVLYSDLQMTFKVVFTLFYA